MTETTDTAMAAAILAELTDELQPWAAVRSRIPGSDEHKAAAMVDLHERHAITAVKLRGATFVRLATDYDRAAAAAERDRQTQTRHPLPVSRCRTFVST
ncbi:hypothetical protein [Mycolicibacterium aubagnense]|uniref:Uncharacterized protein n=1 Tax=Mycolicibacterium aubagnense TaxID=319707 RepID=A0ABN5YPS9_9MYCO|nr:hypothetical protein [Mycolicibacterium aubagnense]TLH59578.1 hypothetical protein C1S80_18910 [Mycolicibacterium aubagnense]WGI34577.1 hypothetical protein QDT91_09660 [Mycolicibacterium aubagnense]BBX83546.1 hypothetical protein MAUB_14190 [Mycolicibacterium aubagnense]